MNLAEKILAAHAGKKSVTPGQFLNVRIDLVMSTDATGLISVQQFKKMGGRKVFDPQKIVFIMDHFTPCRDIESAQVVKTLRTFALEQNLIWFEIGKGGICHTLLPDEGLVLPGDILVGGDSHTCTAGAVGAFGTGMGSTDIAAAMATGETWMVVPLSIKLNYHGSLKQWVGGKDLILHTIGKIGVDGASYAAMEFGGKVIDDLSMDHRFTMANMAVEAGAKVGLFPVDVKTLQFVKARSTRTFTPYYSDPDSVYERTYDFEISELEPQVSLPHSPANVKPVDKVGLIEIDQAVIGSCTNGRLEDLRIAAEVLKNRQVNPRVRCIILPGTQEIYLKSVREGLVETFIKAGAAVSTPTCGPCPGGHMGVMGAGEKAISSTNRNFIGRMGSPKAEIFLANPAVVAASAVTGYITHPKEVVVS